MYKCIYKKGIQYFFAGIYLVKPENHFFKRAGDEQYGSP